MSTAAPLRSSWIATAFVAAVVFVFGNLHASFAQTAAVPADLQATLISKVVTYDRNFASRAGALARVFIVVRRDSARSQLSADALKSAFSSLESVGGRRHEVRIVAYETPAALAKL